MTRRTAHTIIKYRYITEKAKTLEGLKDSQSSKSLKKFQSPKYVFIVDPQSSKQEIAKALEEIYQEQKIKVKKVNTIIRKPKPRRVRGHLGKTKLIKKAVVTLSQGELTDE